MVCYSCHLIVFIKSIWMRFKFLSSLIWSQRGAEALAFIDVFFLYRSTRLIPKDLSARQSNLLIVTQSAGAGMTAAASKIVINMTKWHKSPPPKFYSTRHFLNKICPLTCGADTDFNYRRIGYRVNILYPISLVRRGTGSGPLFGLPSVMVFVQKPTEHCSGECKCDSRHNRHT